MSTTTMPPAHSRTGAIRDALHHAGLPYDWMPLGAHAPGLPDHDCVYLPRLRAAVWVESTQPGVTVVVDGLTGDRARQFDDLDAAARWVSAAAHNRFGHIPRSIDQLDRGDHLQRWLYTRLQWDHATYPEGGTLGGLLREFAERAEGTVEHRRAWQALAGIVARLDPGTPVGPEALVKVARVMGFPVHPDHARS